MSNDQSQLEREMHSALLPTACDVHIDTVGASSIIDHFTVADLVTWPLNGSDAGVDLVLMQTSLFLLC